MPQLEGCGRRNELKGRNTLQGASTKSGWLLARTRASLRSIFPGVFCEKHILRAARRGGGRVTGLPNTRLQFLNSAAAPSTIKYTVDP